MEVIETTLGTETSNEPDSWFFKIMSGLLRKLIPLSNPDFDGSYVFVRKWWIEVDERGRPQRELGFDAHGTVIVAGPLGDNFGFWTDSDMTFRPAEYNVVAGEVFGSVWAGFHGQWEANRGTDRRGHGPHTA